MKQRILTGLIAGAGFLTFLAIGGYFYHALLLVMALVGFDELIRMSQSSRKDFPALIGYAGIGLLVFPWENGQFVFGNQIETWMWLLMFLIMSAMVLGKNRTSIDKSAVLFFGVLYIGFGFHYMAVSRWMEDGLLLSLLIFICIWITDAGAYFTGYVFGKHKLWPAISPKKTIEGSIGGIVLAVTAAVGFHWLFPEIISLSEASVLGLTISLVGQAGDLIQSAYKRTYGVKDSGTLLPGHGGVLDRCDSWIIVFPFVHLVLGIIT